MHNQSFMYKCISVGISHSNQPFTPSVQSGTARTIYVSVVTRQIAVTPFSSFDALSFYRSRSHSILSLPHVSSNRAPFRLYCCCTMHTSRLRFVCPYAFWLYLFQQGTKPSERTPRKFVCTNSSVQLQKLHRLKQTPTSDPHI